MSVDKPSLPGGPAHLVSSGMDERIARMSKILSTSSGVDATLTFVGYGLFLVGSQVSKLESLALPALSRRNTSPSSQKSHANAPLLLKLAALASGAKNLAAMCADVRTFTRLWGLLGVYAMARRQYLEPASDALTRAVTCTQTLSLGLYYFYENAYYLAGKGVLQGWTREDIGRWARVSMRLFLAYVAMEYVRLYRARQLRLARKQRAMVRGVSDAERREFAAEEAAWTKTALINVAYTPLCLHWVSEKGMLSDGVVGALMSYVGWIKVKGAWAATA
ncbi:uncharacterized protein L3040_006276 [Drepanopeziza brunnea f. sp. 'multigermtubi']|uniref:25D9-5p n=1 Tax=Marssonina brunnea f. sp. multigermtubi (strain MB_m1) TaxID=1072389 RepID=K1WUQ4_MARBU|nr:25D9-5p [Drepanopeziza brunnea f. sp. 'multigermtubi' MB_m1]EKD16776.1 25D9-5p [Drepanopeziza brunnea f. sp. 'multigermtubi' MB_m1]KAJ5040627.1 hypothetical protein L3040_006276 [Drepanopeziza brunnea f. sp. 'multigermtubi']